MKKQIDLIGIGMDGRDTLTIEAQHAIQQAELLIGAKRMTEPFAEMGKEVLVSYQPQEIAKAIGQTSAGFVAVLLSGDCGFYSGAKALLPLLQAYDTRCICGISTPIYLAGRLQMSWQDWHLVSLHGMDANIARCVAAHEKTFFLLGGAVSVSTLCRHLCAYGLGEAQVYAGADLSLETEQMFQGTAAELTEVICANLCAVLVHNPAWEQCPPAGIGDDRFIRGRVPMTKSEVRTLCVTKLQVKETDICWDMGCGTGSVSVELAIRCSRGKVYAVDQNTEAVELTKENSRRFACDNIVIHQGRAEEVAQDLPAPDAVFIGGSGGGLEQIIDLALEKNPRVRLLVTAVSLETLAEAHKLLEHRQMVTDITQLAVTRTRRVGSHTMLAAENPIYLIDGHVPENRDDI